MIERCRWAVNGPQNLKEYHDHEWGIPEHSEQKLFELLSLETYQAGLSWQTVLDKRAAFKAVFFNYEIEKVAEMTEIDLEKLLQNIQIIRHRLKLAATIQNAQAVVKLWKQNVTLNQLLWESFNFKTIDHQVQTDQVIDSTTSLAIDLSKKLKQAGFKFMSPVTTYSLMQAAGLVNDHEVKCQYHG